MIMKLKILGFLREREVIHYQRFGETLMHVQENLSSKNLIVIKHIN